MAANALNGFAVSNGDWVNSPLSDPLSILVVNLMPNKTTTELQYLRLLDSTKHDVEVTFCYPRTHHFKGTKRSAIQDHYLSFPEVARYNFDGLIISGAPVETLPFSQVDYWQEFRLILRWAESHVEDTILECWAALAGLQADYHVEKRQVPCKLFGIYTADSLDRSSSLTRGFADQPLRIPQSRHSTLQLTQPLPAQLDVVANSYELGPLLLRSQAKHRTYITGHPEYFSRTLADEYFRDLRKGLTIQAPRHYFTDHSHNQVNYDWQYSSRQLYDNWLELLTKEKETVLQ